MVATKLSEVAGKGWGWFAIPYSNQKQEVDAKTSSSLSASSSASLHKAAQSAYSGITNVYSSLHVPSFASSFSKNSGNNNNNNNNRNGNSATLKPSISEEDGLSASSAGWSKSSNNGRRRRKSILSPQLLKLMHNPYIGVRGGGRLHRAKPPHESMDAVRKLLYVVDEDKNKIKASTMVPSGAYTSEGDSDSYEGGLSQPSQRLTSSPSVHFDNEENVTIPLPSQPSTPSRKRTSTSTADSNDNSSTATPRHRNTGVDGIAWNNARQQQIPPLDLTTQSYLPQLETINSMSRQSSPSIEHEKQAGAEQDLHPAQSSGSNNNNNNNSSNNNNNNNNDEKALSSSHSPEETASQLTEGTLRAMRDLALDEALALHASLKYWSDRWERPIFSWFVAGPLVWFGWIPNTPHCNEKAIHYYHTSKPHGGYDHAIMVGQRVSQIQAVLARRLSAIGELQHHLLRAGWQRGVAHWGFLGEGGNWAAVDGTDGRMMDDDTSNHSMDNSDSDDEERELYDEEHYYTNNDENPEDSEHFFAESQPFDLLQSPNSHSQPQHQHQHQYHHQQHPNRSHRFRLLRREFSEASVGSIGLHIDVPPTLQPHSMGMSTPKSVASRRLSQHDERRKQGSLYYTNLHVRKRNGGHIQKDDSALCEWSIDALALIRSQLIRAANGKLSLPYSENWPFEHSTSASASIGEDQEQISMAPDRSHQTGMPVWAGMKYVSSNSNKTRTRLESRASLCFSITEHADPDPDHHNHDHSGKDVSGSGDADFPKIGADCFEPQFPGDDAEAPNHNNSKGLPPHQRRRSPSSRSLSSVKEPRAVVGISDLPLMMNEVSSLLDVMEDIMDIQKARRLEKLKPPPWWRQNWFLVAMVPPSLGYLLYNNLLGKGQTWNLVKHASEKMIDFAREHVVVPCVALYDEFTKGPESISDHAARDTATKTLKKMIRSWLDETYPEMQEAERVRLSEAMDITLVEQSKELDMKSVYNMNSVIRMSFIEAQFIKKEMMNALVALDEMQASTNFNMNLAAITPFVLLVWTIKGISRFIFYTAFKWGKSQRETYRSFLDALTEIERLLIMRSNPPSPPVLMRYDPNQASHNNPNNPHQSHAAATPAFGDCVLESDDLGMLMLHIHELRMILWQEQRRFSPNALRSVSEDLAELSGERGAVSVRQQLLIVERMSRAYSFLKQGAID